MKKVLVTGGAGYIGSHTCKALAEAGYVPVVFDNLVTGHMSAVRWGPFEYGDILDRTRLDEVIVKHKPEAVIHFAAFAYVAESVANPGKYYRNNVAGSLTLLQAIHDHGINMVVYSSSCAVYGEPAKIPISENAPIAPVNPYGSTKMMVERMFEDFGDAYGLRWVALRYFNAAGADPDGKNGEDHDPETRILPLVIDAAMGERNEFTVYGTDYETPDGTCIRDYVHVSDLADAHVLALKWLKNNSPSRIFNLGTGTGSSVGEIISSVERITGKNVPVAKGPRRIGDPPVLVADASNTNNILGWMPKYSALDDIVRTAWQWRRTRTRR